jgi:hypothetical protein
MREYRVLILGASYGSLLAIKLALAGHHVRLVCLPHVPPSVQGLCTLRREVVPVIGLTGPRPDAAERRDRCEPGVLHDVVGSPLCFWSGQRRSGRVS